ncbi:MAG: hypothetical protein H6737_11355 [Alphaproteobacteria bacterium]|nr:hypothetical protein [Alphaproteobacteria bacterium]
MLISLLIPGAVAQTLVKTGSDLGDHHMALDGRGGVFVVWEDRFSGSDVWIQRLGPYGEKVWDPQGIEVKPGELFLPRVVSDGEDGAIVVWEDRFASSPEVWAQRLDPDGAKLWGAFGVDVGFGFDNARPRVIADGQGGAIVVWEDVFSGSDIRAQRLDADGNALWGNSGIDLAFGTDGYLPELVPDGAGGAVVAWEERGGITGFSDVVVQRLDPVGTKLWGTWGADVGTSYARAPRIAADGAGGAFLGFEDWFAGTPEARVQRVDATGAEQWGSSGVDPGFGFDNLRTRVAADGEGGVYVAWEEDYDDVRVQRVDAAGVELWQSFGIDLGFGFDNTLPELAAGLGGVVVAWSDDMDATVQRLTPDGTRQWGTFGTALSAFGDDVGIDVVATEVAAFVVWREEGTFDDLWVHQLNSDASTGCTAIDVDGDGSTASDSCLGSRDDCDDGDPSTFPGAVEVCDGVDNDCDGTIPAVEVEDGDGDGAIACADCDDGDAARSPLAVEVCDGIDNDCNGVADLGGDPSLEADADGDGARVCDGDCDDASPGTGPGFDERCDGVDNACDGLDAAEADLDQDGQLACATDCDDTDPSVGEGFPEICDGVDDDCDGVIPVDELDADGDGALACDTDCDDADPLVGAGAEVLCDGLDNDCDPSTPDDRDDDGDGLSICAGDCLDTDPAVPAPELTCDGVDNDCDPATPDAPDADGDGASDCVDCAPADPTVGQGLVEVICNGVDEDCDPATPDRPDADGDGATRCAEDCNDADPAIHPGAPELCDGRDNDCDGIVDPDCDTDPPVDTSPPDTDVPDTDPVPDTGGDGPDDGKACGCAAPTPPGWLALGVLAAGVTRRRASEARLRP